MKVFYNGHGRPGPRRGRRPASKGRILMGAMLVLVGSGVGTAVLIALVPLLVTTFGLLGALTVLAGVGLVAYLLSGVPDVLS